MELYNYFRSSASYRVRIVMALKSIDYTYIPVHLLKGGGQQHDDAYTALNPQALVPTLVTGEGVLTQSLAIIEYLDEIYPEPSLLPDDAAVRAHVRSAAYMLAADVQPLINLRVQQYLSGSLDVSKEAVLDWVAHWVKLGLNALEHSLTLSGQYCFGDQVSLADVVLVPQLFSATRFGVDVSEFTRLQSIYTHCLMHPAFQQAHPDHQVDTPPRIR